MLIAESPDGRALMHVAAEMAVEKCRRKRFLITPTAANRAPRHAPPSPPICGTDPGDEHWRLAWCDAGAVLPNVCGARKG
ncbi:hypothetical protein GCM10027200_53440 [Lentzea nigeriaca]